MFAWSEGERRPTERQRKRRAPRRRVVQSGPTQCGRQGQSGLRAPNMFARSEGERRPTKRAGKRQSPARGGPPLVLRSCRCFLRRCASRQSAPPRDGPRWTTLRAVGVEQPHRGSGSAGGCIEGSEQGRMKPCLTRFPPSTKLSLAVWPPNLVPKPELGNQVNAAIFSDREGSQAGAWEPGEMIVTCNLTADC